jgi:creatinine amidohydrolase
MPKVFDQLTAAQLRELHPDRTVFFFAVGPLEDHGPHLPLGLDSRIAVQLAYRCARRLEAERPGWTAVLLPTAPLGVDTDTGQVAIRVRPHVLRDFLVDLALGLRKRGFRHFACFSGHLGPRQLATIEEAGLLVRGKGPLGMISKLSSKNRACLVSASSTLVARGELLQAPFGASPAEHGGAMDTALALAIQPAEVDPAFRSLPRRAPPRWRPLRGWTPWRGRAEGYWGDPSGAEAPAGERTLDSWVETVHSRLLAVWDGADPEKLFRSGYRLLPPNRSFFASYVLALLLLGLLLAFAYVSTLSI